VYLGATLFFGYGISVFYELVFDWRLLTTTTNKRERRAENSFLDEGLGNNLFAPGIEW